MCGIVASPDIDHAIPIASALKVRGNRAWSLNVVDLSTYDIVHTQAGALPFNADVFKAPEVTGDNLYYIFHLQSPTAEQYQFHPATMHVEDTDHFLWHNGMIDSSEHAKYGRTWDTQLLLETIVDESGQPHFENLSAFEGSFACYYLQRGVGLYIFRNQISPQYYDTQTRTYASIATHVTMQSVEPGSVYEVPTHKVVGTFENTYNPFGV